MKVSERQRAKTTQRRPAPDPRAVSVVLPVFNEEESLPLLLKSLFAVMDRLGRPFEIIVVDDGSRDGSFQTLEAAAAERPELKVIQFRRNAGQTAALMAGIDHATSPVIVTLDADLQNDPEDIPHLLEKLDEGFDVVSGWRKDRQDAKIRRNFVSRVANGMISRLSGVQLHDYGCTLKAYRKEVLEGMRLYGEMHRFVPIYASWMGGRVSETPVRHHARQFGRSKYGLERTFKVIVDLMVVMFLQKYLVKPIYVFGAVAVACFLGAVASFGYMLFLKIALHTSFISTPLPVLVSMLFLVGVMSLMMGILAEIMIRTYFESRGSPAYYVRQTINLTGAP